MLAITLMTMTVSNVNASTDYNEADSDKPAQTDRQQPGGPRGNDGRQRQRLTREQLAEKQSSYIVKQLGLDEATAKKFADVYMRNQKEVWEAMPPRPERGQQPAQGNRNATPKTDAESEKQIKNEFAMSEKLLNIRQKYYKEYSKFLSQQQILRIYEIDRQMHERFARGGKPGKDGKMRQGMKNGMKQGMKKGLVNGQQNGGQTK